MRTAKQRYDAYTYKNAYAFHNDSCLSIVDYDPKNIHLNAPWVSLVLPPFYFDHDSHDETAGIREAGNGKKNCGTDAKFTARRWPNWQPWAC
jgi:hypothetical protein